MRRETGPAIGELGVHRTSSFVTATHELEDEYIRTLSRNALGGRVETTSPAGAGLGSGWNHLLLAAREAESGEADAEKGERRRFGDRRTHCALGDYGDVVRRVKRIEGRFDDVIAGSEVVESDVVEGIPKSGARGVLGFDEVNRLSGRSMSKVAVLQMLMHTLTIGRCSTPMNWMVPPEKWNRNASTVSMSDGSAVVENIGPISPVIRLIPSPTTFCGLDASPASPTSA